MTPLDDKIYGLPQVTRDHYFNSSYLSTARFLGLKAQLDLCTKLGKRMTDFLKLVQARDY